MADTHQAFLKSLEEEYERPLLVRNLMPRSPSAGLIVTIELAAGQLNPVNAGPINFTVTFSKTVTGFTNADVSFAGSTVGGTLAAAVTGTGPYNVAVTGMTGIGNVAVSIVAGAATDAAGNLSPASASATVGFGSALPTGVFLQAVDGGANYYSTNGFVNAAAAGWDTNVIPICQFLETMLGGLNGPTIMNDTGCNTLLAMQTDGGSIATLRSNGIAFIPQASQLDQIISTGGASPGSETVGILAMDEPNTYQDAIGALQTTLNVYQDQRFWYENYTWNQIGGDVEGHLMSDLADDLITTPNGTKRHLDILTLDIYWMAGDNGADGGAYNSGSLYNIPGAGDPLFAVLTQDQRRRGCRYGDTVTWMRESYRVYEAGFGVVRSKWCSTYPAPTGVWIETGGPYSENVTLAQYIQPAELNAAVWNTIIHGARMILYFGHSFGTAPGSLGGGWVKGVNFYQTIYPGQSISIYNQVKATNALVQQLGAVINAPFALGYATVSPAGWKFGDPGVLNIVDVGFDIMAKNYNNKLYIFAMPRYSPVLANQTATFTIKALPGTTIATVINEARTIPLTGGGTTFTDTFANGHTVHIYRID